MKLKTIKFFCFLFCFSSIAFASSPESPHAFKGFYAGLNTGYVGAFVNTQTSSDPALDNVSYLPSSELNYINQHTSQTINPAAWMGSIEAGYNWQAHHWLLGLEADLNYLDLNNTNTIVAPQSYDHNYSFTVTQKIQSDWLLTVRPRIGFVSRDRFLFYLTGGIAVARLSNTNTYSDNLQVPSNDTPPVMNPSNAFSSAQLSTIKSGWVVGAGEEILLTHKWSVKFEYLYVNFPNIMGSSQLSINPELGGPQPLQYSTQLQLNILHFGVNYHF